MNCAIGAEPGRSIATRFWRNERTPDAGLTAAGREIAGRLTGRAGRVESGGTFENPQVSAEVARALPDELRSFLRPAFEWYGCRGAFFHNDAHYDGVLFGVWSLDGPPRDVVFSRVGVRARAAIGCLVVFDPYEPHAVLAPGKKRYLAEDYAGAEANLFLGFELTLAPEVRRAFGVGAAEPRRMTLSSRIAINPETGAIATSTA